MRIQLLIIALLSLNVITQVVSGHEIKNKHEHYEQNKVLDLYQEAYSIIDNAGSRDSNFFKHSMLNARELLEEILYLDPNFPKAYLELARIEMKSNWPAGLSRAEKQILIAKSIDPDLSDTNILLGYVYTNTNRYDLADKVYQEAEIAENKEVKKASYTDDGIVRIQKERNLWLYANWGLNFELQDKKEQAIEKYLTVLNSPSKNTYRNRRVIGWVYTHNNRKLYKMLSDLNRTQEADELFFQQANDLPKNTCTYLSQAKHRLYEMNSPQLAMESYQKARKLSCNIDREFSSIVHYKNWSMLKESSPNSDLVITELRKAQALSPDDNILITSLLKSQSTSHLINEIPELNINFQDQFGSSALTNAIQENSYENVKTLLLAGADPNVSDSEEIHNNPLFLSIMLGTEEITKLLLKHGANPDKQFINGITIKDILKEQGLSIDLQTL